MTFDSGLVVARAPVDILPNDTPEQLAARLLPVEHLLQLRFWEDLATKGDVPICNRENPLIAESEAPLLQQAIVYARGQYPNG